jgi:hypothetical protein
MNRGSIKMYHVFVANLTGVTVNKDEVKGGGRWREKEGWKEEERRGEGEKKEGEGGGRGRTKRDGHRKIEISSINNTSSDFNLNWVLYKIFTATWFPFQLPSITSAKYPARKLKKLKNDEKKFKKFPNIFSVHSFKIIVFP